MLHEGMLDTVQDLYAVTRAVHDRVVGHKQIDYPLRERMPPWVAATKLAGGTGGVTQSSCCCISHMTACDSVQPTDLDNQYDTALSAEDCADTCAQDFVSDHA